MKSILLRVSIASILALVALAGVWGLLGLSQAQGSESLPSANASASVALANQILYVDHDAPGPTHDGLSWTTAFTNVQDALTGAGPGDEIWVAEGVYRPDYDPGSGTHTGYVTATFALAEGVALYGGFDGTESSRAQRDWESHVTVLSGDLAGDDATDLHGVVTSTANIVGDNAWTVVTGSGVTETAVLDGFVVTAGQANGSGGDWRAPHRSGGGMHNDNSAPTLANVTFSGNSAGAYGGGMFNWDSAPALTNVTFSGNSADTHGGGMYNWDSAPTLTNVTFSGNSADTHGGGMHNDGSAPTLANVTFSGNSANDGGGMYNSISAPTLANVTFSGNSAGNDGGGMFNSTDSAPTLTNVTFSGNSANDGGGMYNAGSDPTLTNVTFSGNNANADGGGMYNWGPDSGYVSDPTLTNCILWGNTAGSSGPQIYNYMFSVPRIAYSDVQGSGGSGTGWDSGLGTDRGGNIDADPLFVRNPDPGDGDWTTLDDNDYGDLRLLPGSPAIDAGDDGAVSGVATDLAGNPRVIGPHVDMGAYEYLHTLYVDADAVAGAGTGLSWADAYTQVQTALALAIPGDEIWVAEGVYRPDYDPGSGTHTGHVSATFALAEGVALYGGFDGTESSRAQRDWESHVTVLSGDLAGDDATDLHGVVTSTANIVGSDNVYQVVTGSGVTETAVLDGFVVTAGQADGSYPQDRGGGMYNDGSAPTLRNVTFSGNSASAGGGMHNVHYSDPVLTNVTFSGNSATDGGGMYNDGGVLTLTNVTFSSNSATYGGGMYNYNSSAPTLTNCILWGNTAGSSGPQIYNSMSTPLIAYSDVQGSGGSGTGWDPGLGTDGGHNIDADPLFVRDPDPGDGDWTTLGDNDYGDLRLQFGSPAIDAGDDSAVSGVATDLAGNPRISGLHVDMGAYEALPPVYLPLVLRNH